MWRAQRPVGKREMCPRLMSRGAHTLTHPGALARTALLTQQMWGEGMTECAHSREQINAFKDMG